MDWTRDNNDLLKAINIPADRQAAKRLLDKYPWFTSARIILDGERVQPDVLLGTYLLTNPLPLTRLKKIDIKDIHIPAGVPAESIGEQITADDIIDKFLKSGERRIVPSENMSDYDASSGSSVLEMEDGMVTEELAEIYKSQGLTEKAEEIYRVLKQNK